MASGGATRFVGRVLGPVAAIREALRARGGEVEEHGAHVTFDLRSDRGGGDGDHGGHLTTGELARICDAAGVAILELRPLAGALL